MRKIDTSLIASAVEELSIETNYNMREDILSALKISFKVEESLTGRSILSQLIENAAIAREKRLAICQDTGMVNVLIELGQGVTLTGGPLDEAVNQGIRRGYNRGFLRKSIVSDPLYERKNTGDNTPALMSVEVTGGDKVKVHVMSKGAGSENVGVLKMLLPGSGEAEVERAVIEAVKKAGPNPCPPLVIGLGIGGSFDHAPYLAKKALLRSIDIRNGDPRLADFEKRLLERVNELGIGPGGLGGRVTALGVNIESYPCHMASLPLAINFGCAALRSGVRSI
ncbi:MAG: fumarate hydratase [Actinomycetota bacterium]|nr:fumarate hydratase [Actinomycetota bacterium]